MINLQIEILEIFPSINELMENEDDNIIIIMIVKGIQNVFNLSDIIHDQIPITLKLKEIKTIINIEIYRNENIIADGDFLPFNDVKWLNIKFKSNYLNKNEVNLNNTIRMKFKCLFIKENLLRNNNNKKSKISKKNNLYNKSNLISSPRETETNKNKKNIHQNKIPFENISKDNKYNKRKGKMLLYNKSNEDNYFSQNTIYSQSSQISIDDSIQYNNPLCNSISGISNLRKNSLDNNNNKIIKRLNSQEETNRKKRKNQDNKNNLITNNKTSTLSTRDSKEKLKNSNNITNFSTSNNIINKKFDDNFHSIDEAIIDKEFENEIALDEMINSNKIKYNFSPRKINLDCSLDSVSSYNFEKVFNKESDDESEEIINCNFENLKNDFEIFYTQEYLNNISNDVIELEIQLLFEKIFEMQNAYHLELGFLRKKFLSFKNNYESFSDKFLYLNKKFDKLKQKNERIGLIKNKFSIIVNNLIESNYNLIQNNKNEFELWKRMIYQNQNKKKLLDIFNKIVLDKINERKLYLNNVEKFICENFLKKYKIKVKEIGSKNDIKNKNLSPGQLIKTQKQFKNSSLSCPRKQNTNNQKTIKPYKSKLNTNK